MTKIEVDDLSDEQLAHALGDNLAGPGTSVGGPDLTEPFDKFEDELDQAARAAVQKPIMVGVATAILAAGASGCRPKPTATPPPPLTTVEYRPGPTATPEVEIIWLQEKPISLSLELLKRLANNGLGSNYPSTEIEVSLTPEAGSSETKVIDLGELTDLNWLKKIMAEGGPKTPIEVLQTLISAAAGVGNKEAATINLTDAFPALKEPVRFFCGQWLYSDQLEKVLPGEPLGVTLRRGAQVLTIGRFQETGEWKVVIAFSDWVYVGDNGQIATRDKAPKVSFAIINEKDLEGLLKEINPETSYQDGVITFQASKNQVYKVAVNKIEEELAGEVKRGAGLEYVANAQNPVVPYPPEELMKLLDGKQWGYSHVNGERGIYPIDAEGNLEKKALLTVAYDEAGEDWVWEKVEEKEVEEFEDVNWTAGEIDRRIKTQEAATGKMVALWPVVNGSLPLEELHLFTQKGAPREYVGLDLAPGCIIVSPFSGEVSWRYGGEVGEDGKIIEETIQVIVEIQDSDGKRFGFTFANIEGIDFMTQIDKTTNRGMVEAGEPLFRVNSSLRKIDIVGSLQPPLETPRTTVVGLSQLKKFQYAVKFDWLKTDSGKIARPVSAPISK